MGTEQPTTADNGAADDETDVEGFGSTVFAKYDGVDGESQDAKHDKWIDVLNVDWVVQPGLPTVGGLGIKP